MADRKTGKLGRILRRSEPRRFAECGGKPSIRSCLSALVASEAEHVDAICHGGLETDTGWIPEVSALTGRRAVVRRCVAGDDVLAAAYGLALTGRRVSAITRTDRAGEIVDPLGSLVRRRVPLVLFLAVDRPGTIERLAETGALLAAARSPRHVLDLSLVARRASELALTPAVVVLDSPVARALEDLAPFDGDLISEFLGRADDSIETPTPAQQLLFGDRRRRVPRWFDLQHVTAHGLEPLPVESAPAAAGRAVYFDRHRAPILDDALRRFAEWTGRPQSRIGRFGARRGTTIVTRGTTTELAAALIDRDRDWSGIGVASIDWPAPFPDDELALALGRTGKVIVIEPCAGDATEPPLLRRIRAALGQREIASIVAGPAPRPSELAAALRAVQERDAAAPPIRLGVASPSVRSGFPKRDALLQRLQRDYPELDRIVPGKALPSDLRPPGTRTVLVSLYATAFPESRLAALAAALAGGNGAHVRSQVVEVAPNLWEARLAVGAEPFPSACLSGTEELALVADLDRTLGLHPLRDMAEGSAVLIASPLDAERLATALPPAWRDTIAGLGLRLFRIATEPEPSDRWGQLVEAVRSLSAGEESGVEPVPWRPQADRRDGEPSRLPLAVRRFGRAGETYDNVARFWGELSQPRRYGAPGETVPDPYVALSAVPGCTATFHDRTPGRETVPRIDPDRCTGCGRCWTACPDSAIGGVAIGIEPLLDAAADWVERSSQAPRKDAASKLRRAHKQLASRLSGALLREGAGALKSETVGQGFHWAIDKLDPTAAELEEMRPLGEAIVDRLGDLPLAVTDPFFRQPHAEQKGSGELLLLAVNPQSCQGCGVCAEVCDHDAIELAPQSAEVVERLRRHWEIWERLPDTAGASIARAAQHPEVGPLQAILLSRHCLFSVTGGEGAEAGSGERVAVRQVAAVTEYEMQRRQLGLVRELDDLVDHLREATREELRRGVETADLEPLDAALHRLGGDPRGEELLARLRELGAPADVNLARLQRLTSLVRGVGRLRDEIQGDAGRARFGVVVASGSVADWAARFPHNPFSVPVTRQLEPGGAETAIGLLEGMLVDRLEEARLLRRARLLLEAPADLREREAAIDSLSRRDLTPEELGTVPPLLVLSGTESLSTMSPLLESDLPVKWLVLDDHDPFERRPDPVLLGLARRSVFVLATSIAHPDHLFRGISAALHHPGPALIHIHAPSPRRHGYRTRETIERARLAVACRIHPLLRYDPNGEGTFGLRIDLDGNSNVGSPWVVDADGREQTPADWFIGEERFTHSTLLSDARGSPKPTVPGPNGGGLALGEISNRTADERQQHWRMLQELAGVVTPFAERLRERIADELRERHQSEIESLRADYVAATEASGREQAIAQAERLRNRLLQLAGYGRRDAG